MISLVHFSMCKSLTPGTRQSFVSSYLRINHSSWMKKLERHAAMRHKILYFLLMLHTEHAHKTNFAKTNFY